jgi:DNA-binding ferritin-like protein (Dps family)
MANIIKAIIGVIEDKRHWKQMEARANALPSGYNFVYHKIQKYMWNYAGGHDAGMDMIAIFEDLLGLFEEGAHNGKNVLEITGDDVAAFCDELLKNANTYTDKWRKNLNESITEKLARDSA